MKCDVLSQSRSAKHNPNQLRMVIKYYYCSSDMPRFHPFNRPWTLSFFLLTAFRVPSSCGPVLHDLHLYHYTALHMVTQLARAQFCRLMIENFYGVFRSKECK